MTLEDVARILDEKGLTLVNYLEPQTGEPWPVLDWEQVRTLLGLHQVEIGHLNGAWSAARAQSLRLGEALTRAYTAARPGETAYEDLESVPGAVSEAIANARAEREAVEITDEMLTTFGQEFFGPAVVYDREKARAALAHALAVR